MKKIKKYLVFLLTICLFTGLFGMESHAAEMEQFLDPIPIYRLSLTKDKETMMYTAFYMQDLKGNIYLISSAFAGAAMNDGWSAALHTSSGEKRVEHLKTENGISYLKAEIPENSFFPVIQDAEEYEDGSLLCAKKVEKKIENLDDAVITSYTWSKWYVDFIGWYEVDGFYINDEMYMSKVYLEDVKLYGAPLVNLSSDSIKVIGTLYLDENYCPIVVDFRKLGLSESYAIGKVNASDTNQTMSDTMMKQLNSMDVLGDDVFIDTDTLPEIEVEAAAENEGQMDSEKNYLPVVIGGVAVIAAIFYIRKRKQKVL